MKTRTLDFRSALCAAIGVGLLAAASASVAAPTSLSKGDLAIVGYATDSTDGVWLVTLVDIAEDTEINLTQNAAQSDGTFSTSENSNNLTYTFTADTTAGTIIPISWAGMSDSGDQVFVYQGTLNQENLICALSSSPWITTGTTSANTSYAPSGLTAGTHYPSFASESDNG